MTTPASTRIDIASTPQRNAKLKWREFGTGVILLDPESGEFTQLNDAGADIWRELDGHTTVAQVIERLGALFGAESTIAEDCLEFLEDLARGGMILISDGSR